MVLVYELLELVHHEAVEGSTKRVRFRDHISFLNFNVEKGSDDCLPEVGEEGNEGADQVAHGHVDRGRRARYILFPVFDDFYFQFPRKAFDAFCVTRIYREFYPTLDGFGPV